MNSGLKKPYTAHHQDKIISIGNGSIMLWGIVMAYLNKNKICAKSEVLFFASFIHIFTTTERQAPSSKSPQQCAT